MTEYIIKSTMLRANPAVIREFAIPAAYSIGDLGRTAGILTGLSSTLPRKLFREGPDGIAAREEEKKETLLGSSLTEGDSLRLVFGEEEQQLILLLEVKGRTEREDAEKPIPRLLRFRGYMIPPSRNSIREINDQFYRWKDSYNYYYGRQTMQADDYLVSQETLEKLLRRAFAPETLPREINPDLKMPLQEMLDTRKLTEIKEMIQKLGIYEIYLYQNKRDLIRDLAVWLSAEKQFEKIMSEMTVSEYRRLQELIYSVQLPPDLDPRSFPVLSRYGLIGSYVGMGIRIAGEFLADWKLWTARGGEKDWLAKKYPLMALSCALKLYETFPRTVYEQLLAKLDPGISQLELARIWKEIRGGALVAGVRELKNGWIYDSSEMPGQSAEELASMMKLIPAARWYLPDSEEAERIAEKGVELPAELQQKLQNILVMAGNVNIREIVFVLEQLAIGIHMGFPLPNLMEYIRNSTGLRLKTADARAVEMLLTQAEGRVRKAALCGHTTEEMLQKR